MDSVIAGRLAFVVIVLVVGCLLGLGAYTALPIRVSHTSAGSSGSGGPSGLDLQLEGNATTIASGEVLTLTLQLTNELPSANNMSRSSDWASPLLDDRAYSSSPCPSWGEILVFGGYFVQANLSVATSPIAILPLVTPFCPISPFSYYFFEPSSSEAVPGPGDFGALTLTQSVNVVGNFLSGSHSPSPLPPGVYTAVGGDEWGQVSLLYFTVVG